MIPTITIYTLSTCSHCAHAKEYLEEHEIPYEGINVDFKSGDERNQVMDTVRKLNPAITFPTIVIGEKVIVGFRREEIEAALKECEGK